MARSSGSISGAGGCEAAEGGAGAAEATSPGVTDWLSLAAAPTFAMMALLTGFFSLGTPDMLCSGGPGALSLGGMWPMYLLMSVFHSAPWLKRIVGRRAASGGQ